MLVVYVAGPFEGAHPWATEQNIRRAEELSLKVWQNGMAAVCPHTNTRFFVGAADREVWLKGDIEILKRCDAVLLAPGHEISSGTQAEIKVASGCGIPVFGSMEGLLKFKGVVDPPKQKLPRMATFECNLTRDGDQLLIAPSPLADEADMGIVAPGIKTVGVLVTEDNVGDEFYTDMLEGSPGEIKLSVETFERKEDVKEVSKCEMTEARRAGLVPKEPCDA